MATESGHAFLGVGWTYPPTTGADGAIDTVAYAADVRQAVWIIVGTNNNERVMRPDFGAHLRALVFEPMSTTTIALVRHRVEQALIRWEPRIDSITVDVRPRGALGRLEVEVRYRVRATNTFDNLVYPFYLAEGRPS